jgi:hypothetical protein
VVSTPTSPMEEIRINLVVEVEEELEVILIY